MDKQIELVKTKQSTEDAVYATNAKEYKKVYTHTHTPIKTTKNCS